MFKLPINLWSLAHLVTFTMNYNESLPIIKQLLIVIYILNFFSNSKIFFTLSLFLSIAGQSYFFPELSNHGFILLMLDLYFIINIFSKISHFHPPYRTMGFIYIFAGASKLNHDFLNSAYSCITMLPLNFIPFTLKTYSVIIIELALGFLFLFFSGRMLLILSLIFHTFLAFYGFHDFLAVIILLFFSSALNSKKHLPPLVYFLPYFFIWFYVLFLQNFHIPLWRFFYVISFIVPCLFLAIKSLKEFPLIQTNTKLTPAEVPILFLVLWQGIGPYLGLANYPAFTMFSNLQITSYYSNSLFIDRPILNNDPKWVEVKKGDLSKNQNDWRLRSLLRLQEKTGETILLPDYYLLKLDREADSAFLKLHGNSGQKISYWKSKFLQKKPFILKYCQW